MLSRAGRTLRTTVGDNSEVEDLSDIDDFMWDADYQPLPQEPILYFVRWVDPRGQGSPYAIIIFLKNYIMPKDDAWFLYLSGPNKPK